MGSLRGVEQFRVPKGSQKGANGTTLGAHSGDKWKSENDAPACTGAPLSGSKASREASDGRLWAQSVLECVLELLFYRFSFSYRFAHIHPNRISLNLPLHPLSTDNMTSSLLSISDQGCRRNPFVSGMLSNA